MALNLRLVPVVAQQLNSKLRDLIFYNSFLKAFWLLKQFLLVCLISAELLSLTVLFFSQNLIL